MRKGTRLSKFESKCDEGFFLGYFSSSKAYRVYNKTHGFIKESYDVEFDETNGSQELQENLNDVRNEGLNEAIKGMSIVDIKPRDEDEDDVHLITSKAVPSTSNTNDQSHQNEVQAENDDSISQAQLAPNTSISSTSS